MARKANFFQHYHYQRTMEYYQEQDTPKSRGYVKVLILLATTVICTVFFSMHIDINTDQSLEYRTVPGYMWTNQKVVAEFTFPVYKNYSDYVLEVNKAKDNALPVFFIDRTAELTCYNHLDAIYKNMKLYCTDSLKSANGILVEPIFNEMITIQRTNCGAICEKIYLNVKEFMKITYQRGFINEPISSYSQSEICVQSEPNFERIIKKQFLSDLNTIVEQAKKYLNNRLDEKSLAIALEIVKVLNHPKFIYSKELSDKNKELAGESVARYEGLVRKGETIIAKGEPVTETTLKKLTSYRKSRLLKKDVIYTFWTFVGGFGHASMIYSILILYLFFIRKRIFSDNLQVSILSLILILASFFSWLTITIPTKLPIEYLIFIPSLSMLAAIVFDSRTAFYTTVAMALMAAGIRGNDYSTGLIMLFSGTIAAYTVRDIQNKTQMFQSILFILIGFVIGIIAINMERVADVTPTLNQLAMASINSILSPIITFGLLIFIERFTRITTDVMLQEFENVNHPLLIKLNEVAPGTFQHTMSMASLAERCASAINASPLLAKVGGLYHDIGKTFKPDFFIENQLNIQNKHDEMTPKQSAEAIRQHVIEGIKLAHEYKLPQRIIDFIPAHHGTTLIKHFYATALEQTVDKNTVNEVDFRYPGPKPFSKETAIVMICDFSEALSRLDISGKDEFDKIISNNIKERILDGQFDEANITFSELQTVKEVCVKSLLGSAHQRIKYKEIPAENKE